MNASPSRSIQFAVAGLCVLALLIVLRWFTLQENPTEKVELPLKVADTPRIRHALPPPLPAEDVEPEALAALSDDASPTNAAVFYRQALALFDALSDEEKNLVRMWRTNIDASVETELCEKIRPICDLMHQASALTNCDWEVQTPLTFTSRLPHLAMCRSLARAATWSVEHCRRDEPAGAVDDLIATSRLGQSLSPALIGHLVDLAIQGMVIDSAAAHATTLSSFDDARLVQLFVGAEYDEGLRRAIEQEADMVARDADRLAALPPDEALRELKGANEDNPVLQAMNLEQALASWRQVAETQREYSEALKLPEAEFREWLAGSQAVREANPFAEMFLETIDRTVDRTQRATIFAAMVVAGLAVVESGPDTLLSHLDPATGQSFVYTQTDDGFELQSGYQSDGQPLRLEFK